jgi:hypothetical protein
MMATLGIFVVATVLLTSAGQPKERHFGIPAVPFLLSK